jgi:hypothetical protein
MAERRDYLAVCNDHGVPLTEFQATFCVRCVQPECSRSRAGGLFETRVATWEERLFENPARMSKDDPLYSLISAKRFIEINTGRIPEVDGKSEWMDPRAFQDESEAPVKPRTVRGPRAPTPPSNEPTAESVAESMAESVGASPEAQVARTPEARSPVPAPSGSPPVSRAPLNTPFSQGLVLDSGSAAPPKPVDRWIAPPVPSSTPLEVGPPIVKVGARIKFTA